MATYKLIQDIEAEDHILGPLTLRQFIFALISVFFFYISFVLVAKGAGFLIILFLPPALFFGFFAVPFGRDQPTEVWALAKIRFYLKPHKRLWDQIGIKQLVTITAPKKIEKAYTDGLDAHEVKSRLKVLAETLDSRGWAIKNVNSSIPSSATTPYGAVVTSDRLVSVDNTQTVNPDEIVPDEMDMLDRDTTVARQFEAMINQSNQAHRQALVQQMNAPTPTTVSPPQAGNQWFMPQTQVAQSQPEPVHAPEVVAQNETIEEEALVSKLKLDQQRQKVYSSNLRTLQPISDQQQVATTADDQSSVLPVAPVSTLTDTPDPAILSLANNNDFTVETIAREAKRAQSDDDQDEVVISLH